VRSSTKLSFGIRAIAIALSGVLLTCALQEGRSDHAGATSKPPQFIIGNPANWTTSAFPTLSDCGNMAFFKCYITPAISINLTKIPSDLISTMTVGRGSYLRVGLPQSWHICDLRWYDNKTGATINVENRCDPKMFEKADKDSISFLKSFYAGYWFSGEIRCRIACGGSSSVSKLEIGDGSLAALLQWDIESGNVSTKNDGAVWAATQLRNFLISMGSWVELNYGIHSTIKNPDPCSTFQLKGQQISSLEAACFTWQEGYAALNQYEYLSELVKLCAIPQIFNYHSFAVVSKTTKDRKAACLRQLSFPVINFDATTGWIGVPPHAVPTSGIIYQDLKGGAEALCFPKRNAPLNFIRSTQQLADTSEFPSEGSFEPGAPDLGSAIGRFAARLAESLSSQAPLDLTVLSAPC